jgi:magnesium-transporting ATPase (P-type)
MKKPTRRQSRISSPYIIINLSLAGIIMMVFIYSGLFSAHRDNHPLPSFYESITGEPAPSSGLSRAFSEIVRGNLDAARDYNSDSLLIFAFFLIQFIQRILVTLLLYKQIPRTKLLLFADLGISVLLLIYCFRGQIAPMSRLMLS